MPVREPPRFECPRTECTRTSGGLSGSLSQLGYSGRADELRRDSLAQIAAAGEFAEYFEPFTGKPLGSPQQSWTAAVALDWSASDHGSEASESWY